MVSILRTSLHSKLSLPKHMGWYDFLVFSKFGAKDLVAMPTCNTPTVVRIDRRNPISISVSLCLSVPLQIVQNLKPRERYLLYPSGHFFIQDLPCYRLSPNVISTFAVNVSRKILLLGIFAHIRFR